MLKENGLRVPEDVAVAGSTGIEVAEHSATTLTTVQLPMVEMGVEADSFKSIWFPA